MTIRGISHLNLKPIANPLTIGVFSVNPNNLKDPKVKEERMIWKGGSGNNKLKDGCEKLDGWNKLYDKNKFDLENKVEDFSSEGTLYTTQQES